MTPLWKFVSLLALVLASIAVALTAYLYSNNDTIRQERSHLVTRSDQRLCGEIESLKGAIRVVILKSPASKGRAFALRKFGARNCNTLPTHASLPH